MNLNLNELEERLLNEFKSYDLNILSIQEFKAETNGYDRAGLIQGIIREVVSSLNVLSDGDYHSKSNDPPFLFFNGKIYQPLSSTLFQKCVREYLYSIGMKAQDWLRFIKHIMASAREPVILKKFVRHPKYVGFKNCVVDFETLEILDFSPKIHIDHQLDYDFDLNKDCPMWKQFLYQVLPSQTARDVIQQFFGLAFLDRYNSENKVEKALILVGEGSNGKSVIFETIMNVFGTRNISNMDLNSLAKGGDEGQRNMAMLENKRFNYCSEEQIGRVIQRSDIFKTLVSGEPIYARRIQENAFRINNIPFLVFNMNKLPKFNDDTHGLYRRILIVAFNIIIPDELQDKRLAYKLKEERPGILRWLYEGFQTLKANNFVFVTDEAMAKVNQDFLDSQDPLRGWMSVCNLRATPLYGHLNDEPQEMVAASLYDSYLKYCTSRNKPSETMQGWGRSMSDKGFKKRRSAEGNVYTFFGGNHKLIKDPEVFRLEEGVTRV